MSKLCWHCNGPLFDNEGSGICGDCLLSIREAMGVVIAQNGDVYYRLAPRKWVLCEWKAFRRNAHKKCYLNKVRQ